MLRKYIGISGLICCFLLFLTVVMYYVPIPGMASFSLISLLVPWLVLVNLFFVVYWLFNKRPLSILHLTVIVLSYITFGKFYVFGEETSTEFDSELRVMTYNVRNLNRKGFIDVGQVDQKILEFVKEQQPDIICFQEFSSTFHKQFKQYPYKAQTPYNNSGKAIQAILSKYPIVDKGSLEFPDSSNDAIYADVRINNDTIRIYNAHLQSYNIYPSRRYLLRAFPFKLWEKFDKTIKQQREQALYFDTHRRESPYPSIVCADLNNSQFSNIYRVFSNDMKDSFKEAGKGLGYTLKFLGFPMRIDFIFSDPSFEIREHQNFYPRLSDHYPVMAKIDLGVHQ